MKNLKIAIEHAERQAKIRETEEGFLGDLSTSTLKISSNGRFQLYFNPAETKQIESLLREIFEARNIIRDKQTERLNLINELYTGEK